MSPTTRLALAGDAAALLALQLHLDSQSEWMLLDEGEREPSPALLSERPAAQDGRGSFDLIAFLHSGSNNDPQGWLSVDVLPYRRIRHVGYVGVAIESEGRGLGSTLLKSTETEARHRGLSRLELTVLSRNKRARRLYERAGYEIEGTRRGAMLRGGRLEDELYMARLLT